MSGDASKASTRTRRTNSGWVAVKVSTRRSERVPRQNDITNEFRVDEHGALMVASASSCTITHGEWTAEADRQELAVGRTELVENPGQVRRALARARTSGGAMATQPRRSKLAARPSPPRPPPPARARSRNGRRGSTTTSSTTASGSPRSPRAPPSTRPPRPSCRAGGATCLSSSASAARPQCRGRCRRATASGSGTRAPPHCGPRSARPCPRQAPPLRCARAHPRCA